MKTKTSASERLEKSKSIFLKTGFIISLSLVLLAFEYKTYENVNNYLSGKPVSKDFTIELPPIVPPEKEQPKPKITPPVFKVVDDKTEVTEDIVITTEITENPKPVDTFTVVTYVEPQVEEIGFVIDAEKWACFPGGEGPMFEFIGQNIKYPKQALENNISGTVFITFIVEKNGSLSNIVLRKSIGGGCDEEALRIMSIMPTWEPAMMGNKPVRMQLTIPFKFRIKSN